MKDRILVAGLTAALIWSTPCLGHATFFKSETKRTAVTAYTVQGGIAVPVVTNIVSNRISLGASRARRSRRFVSVINGPRPTYTYLIRRPTVRRSVNPDRLRGPLRTPRSGPRTTTVFGTIEAREEGGFLARVKKDGEEVVYHLKLSTAVRDQIESAGADSVSAIIVGKLSSDDESGPLLRVNYVLIQDGG